MRTVNRSLLYLAMNIFALSSANAAIDNASQFYQNQEVELYYDMIDSSRGTTWYAKPLRINSPQDNSSKPDNMWLHVWSDGYYGFFNQYVEIDCKNPIKSHVRTADGNKISFKESMSYSDNPETTIDTTYPYRINRGAVEGLFEYYCL